MKTWQPLPLPSTDMNTYVRDNIRAIMEADSRGTTLPSNPVDGMLYWYVADAARRIVWTLKYNAAGPAGKQWEKVGGDPLEAVVELTEPIGGSGGYVGFTTVCQLTVPLAGEYWAEFGANWITLGGGEGRFLAPKFGTQATSDADAAIQTGGNLAHQTGLKTLVASDVVALQYRGGVSTDQLGGKYLRVHPRRVG